MTKMKYNLGLIFEPMWEERLVSFSQKLRAGYQSSVQLGPEVLPHVTIVQFEASAPEAQEYWKRIQALPPPPSLQVSFSGLTFLPSSKDGMWVEISIYRNKILESLQNQALGILSPRKPHNKVGEFYRPHVTIARFNGFVWPTLKALPYELVRATNLTTYLAIGRSGGQFEIGSLRP